MGLIMALSRPAWSKTTATGESSLGGRGNASGHFRALRSQASKVIASIGTIRRNPRVASAMVPALPDGNPGSPEESPFHGTDSLLQT